MLNHTEGYDTAEFKHGPNTILGRNTLLSVADLPALLDTYKAAVAGDASLARLSGEEILAARPELIESTFSAYPLVFVCPPEARAERITVSQIHTHKIRGADIILVAERRQDLALASAGKPMGKNDYWSKYIEIPHAADPLLFAFGATIVLQYLAYRMSVLKMEWLNGLGVADHGVHPDAPKNVSKSITVD